MRFEKGSPIRGFSLGATAGTLAGNSAYPGGQRPKTKGICIY